MWKLRDVFMGMDASPISSNYLAQPSFFYFPSSQWTLRVLTLLLNNTFKSIPAPVLGIVSSTQPSANWICDQQNTMQWNCKVLGWIIEVWLYQSKHISAEMGFSSSFPWKQKNNSSKRPPNMEYLTFHTVKLNFNPFFIDCTSHGRRTEQLC